MKLKDLDVQDLFVGGDFICQCRLCGHGWIGNITHKRKLQHLQEAHYPVYVARIKQALGQKGVNHEWQ